MTDGIDQTGRDVDIEVVCSRPAVLIAEKTEAAASLLQAAVQRAVACDVSVAHDAAGVAGMMQARAFNLVLLDAGLYEDGLALAPLRERGAGCEIIALTGAPVASRQLKMLAAAGVFAVVAKPFDVNDLVALVLESLGLEAAVH